MCICKVSLLLLIVCSLLTTRVLSASCKTTWKIDWNQQLPDLSKVQPFSTPREILPGVTVYDTLQVVGLLWNAPSWQELTGRVCVQYGPLLNALAPHLQIRKECDMVVSSLQKGENSNISKECSSIWDELGPDSLASSMISDYGQCLSDDTTQDFPSYFSYSSPMCDLDPFLTMYATNIIDRVSPIAFDLLKWIGPSPFSGDFYGACSAVRILLGSRIYQIVNEVKNLLMYPAADALEYLNIVDICTINDETVQEILKLVNDIQGENICNFLSRDPSREEYLTKGKELVNNVLRIPVENALCVDVLTLVSSYDQDGSMGYRITGRNLTSASNRRQLCQDIVHALSDDSSYIPSSYSLPNIQSLENLTVYHEAGEFLPGFPFIEAVNVLGAFFRSDSLLSGGIVLCDVFESFLSELEPSVRNLCDALRANDTTTVENTCLAILLPSDNYHPSLRIPTPIYLLVTGVDMVRKLFKLSNASRDHVCSALDDFYHSNNNLQSVVRFGLNVYLAEFLPIVDKICEDYISVLNHIAIQWGRRYGTAPDIRVTASAPLWNKFILTHLGFSDRNSLCNYIGGGINSSSGRSNNSLAENMQNRMLLFLTDSERCEKSLESFEKVIQLQSSSDIYFLEQFTKFTGYESFASACGNLSVFFDDDLCKEIDPCSSNPCLNGATCVGLGAQNVSCQCAVGFTGSTCATVPSTGASMDFFGLSLTMTVLIVCLMLSL